MKTLHMLSLLFGLLFMLTLAGCSDDDCASCPNTVVPLAYARGVVLANDNGLWQSISISGNGVARLSVDSARVGDSLCPLQDWAMPSDASRDFSINFYEDANSSTRMYDPGDTALVTVWGEGRSSSCRLKLLYAQATLQLITPTAMFSDTIVQGGSDTVCWHRVEYADYYAVSVWWELISGAGRYSSYYTTDTSFIVTGDMMPDSALKCYIDLTPFNGPDPRTGNGNWTGTLLEGVVTSSGRISETGFHIAPALPSPRGVSPQTAAGRPILSADEIVARVYEKYGR